MTETPDGDTLRAMAEHRGLKLVKSRRRKPGTGDYGNFGLTDATGKALLGIGADGLTASAQDIETYLRSGATSKWQESASSLPDKPAARPRAQPKPPTAPAKPKPRPKSKPPPPVAKATPTPSPPPAPAPQLIIRPAASSDAPAIARLLSQLRGMTIAADLARRNLAGVHQAGGGLLLAELGKPIGCCGWSIVQTVQHGPIGRITVIFVAADHRRQGIARQLLAAAEAALADTGCSRVEAISDIEINNAHNFFRTLKFAQSSYRFTRKLGT